MAIDHSSLNPQSPDAAAPTRLARRVIRRGLWFLAAWGVAAYLLIPQVWKTYFRHHAKFSTVDRVTLTSDGHPGDPINIALVGEEAQLAQAMIRAGWFPADAITFRSSIRIAVDSVFRRPDEEAPVSNLYLFGRQQDLAFEQPVGGSPRQRHHVRFWHWHKLENDRPVWFGSATFDERVGLSYTTGQVTHHIGPDVDAERDRIVQELEHAGFVSHVRWIDGFHKQLEGRNGGGDPWRTDGRLAVVVLNDTVGAALGATNTLPSP